MGIAKATRAYETWLGKHHSPAARRSSAETPGHGSGCVSVLPRHLLSLDATVAQGVPDEARAPRVLAVGDLHVENFGTWRDVEGRLVWGINDFDEVYELPYTIDLVRLAASAHIAIRESRLKILAKDACDAILHRLQERAFKWAALPFVLAEEHEWLRHMVTGVLRDPVQFWQKLDSLPT